MRFFKLIILFVAISGLALGALSCQTLQSSAGPKTGLEITPAEIVISPALLKEPVAFKGSGFAPKEMVIVEMVLPPGFKMKGVKEGDDVGIAVGTSDENGNFTAAMEATATLNWFFQVGWKPTVVPNLEETNPLPPGDYKINATGLDSERVATSTMKVVPAPKKK
jgi:hypothetical protein